MTDLVRSLVLNAFRDRWSAIEKALLSGETFADYQIDFEAAKIGDQEELWRKFYSIKHSRQMLALREEVVFSRLKPLIRHLARLPKKQVTKKLVRTLLSSEYILFGYESSEPVIQDQVNLDADELSGWSVQCYPAAANDDWSEILADEETSMLHVLMKATGEAFTAAELMMLADSVNHNLRSYSCDGLFVLDIGRTARINQAHVLIVTCWPTAHYVDPIIDEILRLEEATCHTLAGDLVAYGKTNPDLMPKSIFEVALRYKRARNRNVNKFKQEVANILGTLTDPMEIRLVEDLMQPHLFGGRRYFHSTYSYLHNDYGCVDFLD